MADCTAAGYLLKDLLEYLLLGLCLLFIFALLLLEEEDIIVLSRGNTFVRINCIEFECDYSS